MELVIIFLIVAVVILILCLNYLGTPQSDTNNNPPNPIGKTPEQQIADVTPVSGWGPETDTSGVQGACYVYTFVSQLSGTSITYNPPNYIYNNLIFNSAGIPSGSTPQFPITAVPASTVSCITNDQVSAKLVQHTCTSQESQGYECVEKNGSIASVGQTEQYFTSCTVPTCAGVENFIGLPFGSAGVTNAFVTRTTPNLTVSTTLNDPNTQAFQVSRADQGGNPVNPMGVLAKIFDKNTGLCLLPQSAEQQSQLVMDKCTNLNSTGGYVWQIIPPTPLPLPGLPNNITPQQLCFTNNGSYPAAVTDLGITSLCINRAGLGNNRIELSPFQQIGTIPGSNTQLVQYTIFNQMVANNQNYPLLPVFPTT